MEQGYKEELNKLGFTSNVESIKTVLETRAYHNTFADITDCSYAVLNMPTCFSAKTETILKKIIFDLLSTHHSRNEKFTHYSPIGVTPARIEGNHIQFAFSDALSERELTQKVINILQMGANTIRKVYSNLSPEDNDIKNKKQILNLIGNRIKAIEIFINAGSTSYNYNVDRYDPLD